MMSQAKLVSKKENMFCERALMFFLLLVDGIYLKICLLLCEFKLSFFLLKDVKDIIIKISTFHLHKIPEFLSVFQASFLICTSWNIFKVILN